MKRKVYSLAAILLTMLLPIILFSAIAAAGNILSTQLPVRLTLEGKLPDPEETYIIQLTAEHPDNPMPDGKTGGSYRLSVKGPGNAEFPAIDFTKVGIYTYTVYQIPGNDPNCRYDSRIYTVKVTVSNGEDGELELSVTLREGDKQTKPERLEFRNTYEEEHPPYYPPHRPPSEPSRPNPKPNAPVDTGVTAYWMYYLGGSAVLLLAAFWIIRLLRRKDLDMEDTDA